MVNVDCDIAPLESPKKQAPHPGVPVGSIWVRVIKQEDLPLHSSTAVRDSAAKPWAKRDPSFLKLLYRSTDPHSDGRGN